MRRHAFLGEVAFLHEEEGQDDESDEGNERDQLPPAAAVGVLQPPRRSGKRGDERVQAKKEKRPLRT